MNRILQFIGVGITGVWIGAGVLAHGDHGATAVQAEVMTASVADTLADVQITMGTSAEHPIVLYDLRSDLGSVHVEGLPIVLSPGDAPITVLANIIGADTLPGIFVLELDFGADGSGPLLVIPNVETPPEPAFFTVVDLPEVQK